MWCVLRSVLQREGTSDWTAEDDMKHAIPRSARSSLISTALLSVLCSVHAFGAGQPLTRDRLARELERAEALRQPYRIIPRTT